MVITYQQAKLVKGTVPALREHGERITTIFYQNLIRENPELRDVFNAANQKNGRQPRALTAVILAFAANISHTSELVPQMERVCNKHCSLGIRPEHYELLAGYLLAAFGEVLGPEVWTPELDAAWTRAYWVLARMLIGREAQLYKDFGRWTGWRKFRVDRKVRETDDVYSFYLAPQDGRALPSYNPGQYVSVRVDIPDAGCLQSRQYSLSDAPRPDYYRITVKRDPGSPYANAVSTSYMNLGVVSNHLIDRVHVGSTVEASHPVGEFFLDTRDHRYDSSSNNKNSNISSRNSSVSNNSSIASSSTLGATAAPLVLISAGIGVTPMMAIANAVLEAQPARPISWVHGARDRAPFEDRVAQLRARHRPAFRAALFKTQPADGDDGDDVRGVTYDYASRVDLARVPAADLFLDHGAAEYFVCGSEAFMLEVSDYLYSHGVPASRVKLELFSTGEPAAKVNNLR